MAIGVRLMKWLAGVLFSLPLAWLAWAIWREALAPGSALGADPGEAILLSLGEWGIRLLLLSLSISTLRRRFGWGRLIHIRRQTGLFAFAYLAMHLLAYLGFFAEFSGRLLIEDLAERPYITVGFAALVMLAALAGTSTNAWQRRLKRRWRQLHRLVYPACALGLLHVWWLTRDGYGELLIYGVWLALLYLDRLLAARSRNTPK